METQFRQNGNMLQMKIQHPKRTKDKRQAKAARETVKKTKLAQLP